MSLYFSFQMILISFCQIRSSRHHHCLIPVRCC
nr:MAG TPA: Receptor tyrosine-protein kinase erbB-3 [Caudoviricetes sp.]